MVEFYAFVDNDNNCTIKELAIVSDQFFIVTVFKPLYDLKFLNYKAIKICTMVTKDTTITYGGMKEVCLTMRNSTCTV